MVAWPVAMLPMALAGFLGARDPWDPDAEATAMAALMKEQRTDKGEGTDAVGPHGGAHYHALYAQILAPYRYRRGLVMAKIGANQGDSLNTWVKYFGDSLTKVYGMRYGISDAMMHPCAGAFCSKVKIIDGDQSKLSGLKGFVEQSIGNGPLPRALHDPWQQTGSKGLGRKQAWKNGQNDDPQTKIRRRAHEHEVARFTQWAMDPAWASTGYDIVIDDGSHIPRHMLLTFRHLWPYVRPGGVYIIEDIAFSYADTPGKVFEYPIGDGGIGAEPPHNLIEKFKQLADLVSRPWCHPLAEYTVFTPEIDRSIWSVQFLSGAIVIHKQTAGQAAIIPYVRRVAQGSVRESLYSGPHMAAWRARLDAENKSWDSGVHVSNEAVTRFNRGGLN